MALSKKFHKEFEKIKHLVLSSSFGEKTLDGRPIVRLGISAVLPESDIDKILDFQKFTDNNQVKLIFTYIAINNNPLVVTPEKLQEIQLARKRY